jgi:hypothetical protein
MSQCPWKEYKTEDGEVYYYYATTQLAPIPQFASVMVNLKFDYSH